MAPTPFTIDITQSVLDDLRTRLERTRWVDDLGDAGWTYGASIPYMRELVAYWRDRFDWRAQERALNGFANFRATMKNGLGLHFIHERGRGPRPLPIVLTHGFPDSVVRFTKLIPLLTDPASHGADAADSFGVVAPSLPGYAFSDAPRGDGTVFHIGDLWNELKEWASRTPVPAAFAMHPKDLSSPPREWAERFFDVGRWTEMKRGGHFAALEEPESLARDIREFFRPFRSVA